MEPELVTTLRNGIHESGRSLLSFAKETGLPYASVHGFAGAYRSLSVESAAKLAAALGLELRPVQRGKGRKASR